MLLTLHLALLTLHVALLTTTDRTCAASISQAALNGSLLPPSAVYLNAPYRPKVGGRLRLEEGPVCAALELVTTLDIWG